MSAPTQNGLPSLDSHVLADLAEVLRQGPRAHGYPRMQWSAVFITELLRERHGVDVTAQQCRRLLERHGFKWKFPDLLDNPRWPT